MLWLSPQIELKQFLIYCDPYIAELENCCELQDPKVKRFNASQQLNLLLLLFLFTIKTKR